MNNINLIGRMTKDVDVKYYGENNSKSFAYFSLAVPRTKEKADFINCTAFEKNVDVLEKYVRKGDQIAIEGSLQQNIYKDKNGVNRSGYNVIVRNITLIQPKEKAQESASPTPTEAFVHIPDKVGDDLPFN